MAWKNLSQTSLADAFICPHPALNEHDEIDNLIDWSACEALMVNIHSNPMGERAYPPLLMFKILLLQTWYNLSDPACEKQLARDLLFRRFVQLSLTDQVPDHSTLWRFRNRLQTEGLFDRLLENINDQLRQQGLIMKTGEASIIDASVIQAKNNCPNKNAQGENTQDPEASYNVKTASDGTRKTTYGFKAHINVDEDGFIKKHDVTTGSSHDSQTFETLLTGQEKAVYNLKVTSADSAYKSQAHDTLLKKRKTKNNILHRAYRNTPLTEHQKQHNRFASEVRYIVERTFGILKQHYGMAQARYNGLARNAAKLTLMCISYNLKRAAVIKQR